MGLQIWKNYEYFFFLKQDVVALLDTLQVMSERDTFHILLTQQHWKLQISF